MKIIENLSSDITLTAVCNKGYHDRDMTSYYCGTFLIWASPAGHTIVYCHGLERTGTLMCEPFSQNSRNDNVHIPISELFRFTPRQGYYQLSSGKIVSYTLPTTRSYKKGINRELLRIRVFGMGSVDSRGKQALALMCVCSEPEKKERGDNFILSQRLVVFNGKIYSFFQDKTVGSFTDGVLTTPFASIIDRVNQLHGDIECHLQTL